MSGLTIIGGSYAGFNIATSAREHGYAEPIRILSNEPVLPYHRPPLSKGFLLEAGDADSLPLRGPAFYAEHGIEVLFDAQVHSVTPRQLETNLGAIDFDFLALATGARATTIELPGCKLDGVVTLRSVADAEAIRQRLSQINTVVIIGAGFIGLELAASFRKLDIAVTILEGQQRVLARATTPCLSNFIEAEHRRHAVNLRCNDIVVSIEGAQGKVTGVTANDGTHYPADLVVLAVGARPNCELGMPLGLVAHGAIQVDSVGRTAVERIYAAGDCTVHPNAFSGTLLRLESVQSATDQGRAAGAHIAGVNRPNDCVPWFWSNQYDLKLQMVGLSQGADREIVRGSFEAKKFSIFYFRDKRIIAIDSVNAPADHMLGRRLLSQKIDVSPELLSDPHFDLRALVRAV